MRISAGKVFLEVGAPVVIRIAAGSVVSGGIVWIDPWKIAI